ncbi:MAG: hypothetical protein A4S14_19175 [Proteobacteria bacterium SG_bin9]|nr:MAG: hypothetical protein A4S14_19175 [Proteobacteria bacterium SG_bin9]
MQLTESVLTNDFVRLEPLHERHREELRSACDADPDAFKLWLYTFAGDQFDPFWDRVRKDHASGSWIPYAVMADGECVGISCYIGIEPMHRALEVGNTYYHPKARGTAVNPAAKHLMLGHAFACGANRVQFRVDATNAVSCAAMAKLGAMKEGVYRQEKTIWTGRVRDTVIFSILREEWPRVEAGLAARLADFRSRAR